MSEVNKFINLSFHLLCKWFGNPKVNLAILHPLIVKMISSYKGRYFKTFTISKCEPKLNFLKLWKLTNVQKVQSKVIGKIS